LNIWSLPAVLVVVVVVVVAAVAEPVVIAHQ
jgi:hypothetical protein